MKKLRKLLAFAIVAVFVMGMATTTYATSNCIVTFYLNGGTVGGDDNDITLDIAQGAYIPEDQIPVLDERAGFEFVGWNPIGDYTITSPTTGQYEYFVATWAYLPSEGSDFDYVLGSGNDCVISWDVPFDDYAGEIAITNLTTGKNVDYNESDYDVTAGSTVLTLKAAFLETLEPGEYLIKVFLFGENTTAQANLTIKEDTPTLPDVVEESKPTESTTPKTGDNSNTALYSIVGMAAAAGILSIVAVKKKAEEK